MQRRAFIAAATTSATLIAGCTGGDTDDNPEGTITEARSETPTKTERSTETYDLPGEFEQSRGGELTYFEFSEIAGRIDDGDLKFTVLVKNTLDSEAKFYINNAVVSTAGGTELAKVYSPGGLSSNLIPPNAEKTITGTIDFGMSSFNEDDVGQFYVNVPRFVQEE